jgi:hypothetical protein
MFKNKLFSLYGNMAVTLLGCFILFTESDFPIVVSGYIAVIIGSILMIVMLLYKN